MIISFYGVYSLYEKVDINESTIFVMLRLGVMRICIWGILFYLRVVKIFLKKGFFCRNLED